MRKLAIIFAATVAMLFGPLAWKAEAEIWLGAGEISTAAQSFVPIQQAGLHRRCPIGRRLICVRAKCWCARYRW